MSTGERVVFIDAWGSDGSIEREVLEPRGHELALAQCATDDEVVAAAGDAPAILNVVHHMGAELFARLPKLKVVVRGGVGYDNIDVEAATNAGVIVCNVIDYGTNEVANHAFAMLLALNRSLFPLGGAIRTGELISPAIRMPHTGRLAGETLGLVSFGAIAKAVGRRGAGFDMKVIAHDPFVDPAEAEAMGVELVSLEDLLRRSDYISVHTPLSSATKGLIGAAELAMMKPSAYIVVTSRGGVIDEAALTNALREKQIAGAGIDVWEQEPTDTANPLLQMENVVASMHAAWYSEVAEIARRRGHAEAAADVLDGIRPRSVVNPAVLERVAPLRPAT
jgi:D-3-phosphoglycerate dehydrogenase